MNRLTRKIAAGAATVFSKGPLLVAGASPEVSVELAKLGYDVQPLPLGTLAEFAVIASRIAGASDD